MTRAQVIRRGTAISIGLALMLLTAAVSAAWWVRGDREAFWGTLQTVTRDNNMTTSRLDRVEAELRELRRNIDQKLDAILVEVRR